jgi:hydrogenase nickel incorporation protein HypA/HybF
MHELGIVQEMIEIVSTKSGGAKVKRIVLEIGKNTCVLPDAIRFAFHLASEETVADGATLEIVETSGEELRLKEMEVG